MSDPKSPFARLALLKETLPAGPSREAAGAAQPAPRFGRIVIARSRKGRGGKTVTIVQGIEAPERDAVAGELRRALGCGAGVEGDDVVIQGVQHERVRAWLEEQGTKKIVIGS